VAAALAEAGAVPLSAVDAIHVAAAKRLNADELITAERPRQTVAQSPRPESLLLAQRVVL
jgi:predicted nucleic acid-binding protein